ncbi:AAA family ATPase (plasmid) [Streptomyces sp. NBC_01340]|uniref:ATP-binding protein n=1 Tax=Streptomyces sp. NBC_01340 TaxID=2903830 RepID=UPI002E0D1723|nr:AAA family ATPase [Streptomyces sp. NBC_01340]
MAQDGSVCRYCSAQLTGADGPKSRPAGRPAARTRAAGRSAAGDGKRSAHQPGPQVCPCAHVSTLHGREDALAHVGGLAATARLLTVVGEPGVGKSRLAMELLKELSQDGPVPVFHVDLGFLDGDESALVRAVARAAGITAAPDRPPIELVVETLSARRHSRLVLDNCEFRLDGCEALLSTLLSQCTGLRVLATSREILCLPGEVVYRLGGLDVEPTGDTGSSAAARLFADRAHAIRQDFELSGQNARATEAICSRLDGNPLAIELAAALVRVMSPTEILDGLDDRFSLLDTGWRSADERHRGLWSAIDWSYRRLPPREQALFSRLAVLPGRFGIDAASAVCGASRTPVLHMLRALEAGSLLMAEHGTDGVTRLRMTESVRHFARQLLHDQGTGLIAEDAAVALLRELASPLLHSPTQSAVSRLAVELDTLLWATAELAGGTDERRLALAVGLAAVQEQNGQDLGAVGALIDALRETGCEARHRGAALTVAATLAARSGVGVLAAEFADEAVSNAHRSGDERALARALRARAAVNAHRDDLTLAVQDATAALALSERLGDDDAVGPTASDLVWYLVGRGEWHDAAEAVERVEVPAGQPSGDCSAMLLFAVGALRLGEGDVAAAQEHFVAGLLCPGDDRSQVPWGLEGMACVAHAQHRPARSLRLIQAARQMREAAANRAPPWWQKRLAGMSAEDQRSLTPTVAAAATAEGAAMTGEQAAEYAVSVRLERSTGLAVAEWRP